MAQPNKSPNEIVSPVIESDEAHSLRSQAVAIDPPPSGAIGIQELLDRFERFAEAKELADPPDNGAVGVRELLARLHSLADAGYLSPSDPEKTGAE